KPSGSDSRKSRNTAWIERLRVHRRQPSSLLKWSVTPEVAGSSPVAPVKIRAKRDVVLSRQAVDADLGNCRPPGQRNEGRFLSQPSWRRSCLATRSALARSTAPPA